MTGETIHFEVFPENIRAKHSESVWVLTALVNPHEYFNSNCSICKIEFCGIEQMIKVSESLFS